MTDVNSMVDQRLVSVSPADAQRLSGEIVLLRNSIRAARGCIDRAKNSTTDSLINAELGFANDVLNKALVGQAHGN